MTDTWAPSPDASTDRIVQAELHHLALAPGLGDIIKMPPTPSPPSADRIVQAEPHHLALELGPGDHVRYTAPGGEACAATVSHIDTSHW
jgi:hypothetical protein